MAAIVLNLATAAVTEYPAWAFPALSETRIGSDAGLFTIGGDTDNGAQIDAGFDTGITLRGASTKNRVSHAYVTSTGTEASSGLFRVRTPTDTYEYELAVREKNVSRAKAGRGIHENRLGFGYANLDGADFAIDRIEVNTIASQQRRL